ncbi:MAG: hypothetical protein MI920_24260 [Kiloniellales bacterium]|nr:hypothetical protein [Kiloniellales bacterium]
MRRILFVLTLGLSGLALGAMPAPADDVSGDDVAGDESAPALGQQLAVGTVESGIYDFCLSLEDARVHRDYRVKAIADGLSVEKYRKTRPRTRCYRNKVTFVPLEPAPNLDGMAYAYVPNPRGRYICPKYVEGPKGQRCGVGTRNTRYIKADILYSKMRFPIYVELSGKNLVDKSGALLVGR